MSSETSVTRFHTLILPIIVSAEENETLEKRFNAGYQCYRATSREAQRRLRLLRESKSWQQARKMPKRTVEEVKARNKTLNTAREAHGLTEYDLRTYARESRRKSIWMRDHIDSVTATQLGARVWDGVAKHLFEGAGKPRIPRRDNFASIEGIARKGLLHG